jgi:hypothetical protein
MMHVGGHRGRRSFLAGLVLLALVLAGCASHHAAQAAARSGTVVETFHAYDADGNLAVRVADVGTGHCWTTSIAAPVPGAYRCLSANTIFDPCFAPPRQSGPVQVACVPDPWSGAHVLRVTGALPSGASVGGTRATRPWALELDNGQRCVAATGTVPEVHGVNLDYRCAHGRAAGLVDARTATVTADYGDPRTGALRLVTVRTLWRG